LTLPPEAEGYYQAEAEATDWLAWAYHQDQEGYLPKQVLALSDTFTMAHGLELRVPYLDADLVAWAQQLPAQFHLQQGPKWLLKELLTQLGGKKYAQRRKEGFGLPLGRWIQTGEADHWLAPLYQQDLALWEFINPDTPRQWVQAQKAGKADFAQEIWNVMTVAAWLERK
ncbi:MAG: asparagine synthase-related protein, partial [Bacteroidota bacterium]